MDYEACLTTMAKPVSLRRNAQRFCKFATWMLLFVIAACVSEERESSLQRSAQDLEVDEQFVSPFCSDTADGLDDWVCQSGAARYLYFQFSEPTAISRLHAALLSPGRFRFSLARVGFRQETDAFIPASDIWSYVDATDARAWGYVPTSLFCGMSDGSSVQPLGLRIVHERDGTGPVQLVYLRSVSLVLDSSGELQTDDQDPPQAVSWSGTGPECVRAPFMKAACNTQRSADARQWQCNDGDAIEKVYFGGDDMLLPVERVDEESLQDVAIRWHAWVFVIGEDRVPYCAYAALSTDDMERDPSDSNRASARIDVSRFVWTQCAVDDEREILSPPSKVWLKYVMLQVDRSDTGVSKGSIYESDGPEQWLIWPR